MAAASLVPEEETRMIYNLALSLFEALGVLCMDMASGIFSANEASELDKALPASHVRLGRCSSRQFLMHITGWLYQPRLGGARICKTLAMLSFLVLFKVWPAYYYCGPSPLLDLAMAMQNSYSLSLRLDRGRYLLLLQALRPDYCRLYMQMQSTTPVNHRFRFIIPYTVALPSRLYSYFVHNENHYPWWRKLHTKSFSSQASKNN